MNYIKTAGILAGIAFFGLASVAFAQAASPMSVNIGVGGHATLRGTVTAVSASSISVKSWGGTWTVQVGSATKVTPHAGAANDASDIKVGDTISVNGTAVADAAWTIDAKTISDPAMAKAVEQERKSNENAIKQAVKTTFQGIVSNLSGASFTLTTGGGSAFTVQTNSSTKFLNNRFLSLSGTTTVGSGDHVRVFGTNASGTVTAKIVRDISIH